MNVLEKKLIFVLKLKLLTVEKIGTVKLIKAIINRYLVTNSGFIPNLDNKIENTELPIIMETI